MPRAKESRGGALPQALWLSTSWGQAPPRHTALTWCCAFPCALLLHSPKCKEGLPVWKTMVASLEPVGCSTMLVKVRCPPQGTPIHEGGKGMAEQRTPGSGGTSPAQGSAPQGRDKTHEVSAHVSETAQQVRETASEYYEQ